MKRYPRSNMFSLMCLLGASALLGGCGGGGGDDAEAPALQAAVAPGHAMQALSAGPSAAAPVDDRIGPSSDGDTAQVASAPIESLLPSRPTPDASPASATAKRRRLPLSQDTLLQFNVDFSLAHEGLPNGVPGSYDWFAKPRKGTWNSVPEGFAALTGWGQAFWTQGTGTASAYLLLRNHMTLVCHGSRHQWSLLQASSTEGAEFRPDYAGNVAKPAGNPGPIEAGADAVGFAASSAYHFWPKAGRSKLPSTELCGILVLVQARVEPVAPNSYRTPNMLLGLGADYWLNRTAAWDNYRTNRDVAIGRLRLVTEAWNWFGLSTASDSDLRKLINEGYEDAR